MRRYRSAQQMAPLYAAAGHAQASRRNLPRDLDGSGQHVCNAGTTSTPSLGADNAAKTVNVNGYVKRTPTWPMATVPYSIGEAAS